MNNPPKTYWQNRFEILENAQNVKTINRVEEIENYYKIASDRIEKDISKWYNRIAKNNNITFSEAKQILRDSELKEFKWTVEQYIQYGRENAIDQRWMKQLENASARVHINRLEAIKLQIQQEVEVLFGNQLDEIDEHVKDVYSESFYRTAFEVQKGIGLGSSFAKLDDNMLAKIISKPWTADGLTFSDRVWKDKKQLIETLHRELTQSIIRGDTPNKAIASIRDLLGADGLTKTQATYKARRLVMTESAFFHSQGQKDSYDFLEVEQYEILAVLDKKTSEICQELDGKVFEMKDFQVGITSPPFHVFCRTTTIPYFADDISKRTAKNAKGNDIKVPMAMKYKEWYDKFIEKEK
jgi:SPP1 gp7 family putative phage head morphogenesis protein